MPSINQTKELAFIVGIGRSGTTVLNKLLNSHPELHCMPEANFLVFFLHAYKDFRKFTSNEIENIFKEIEIYAHSHPWVGWNFSAEDAKHRVKDKVKRNPEIKYEELCKLIYEQFEIAGIDKAEAKILIDKNPSYTIYMDEIMAAFKNTRFIYLVRDYRANVLSRKQSVYFRSADVAFNAWRWRIFNLRAYRFCKKHPENVILVRYEDLVTNAEQEMFRIYKFLGVEVKMFPLNSEAGKVNVDQYSIDERFKDRFKKKYSDLNKPLNPDRIFTWKEQLKLEEIRICESFCGDFAAKLKYNETQKLNYFEKLSHRIQYSGAILKANLDVYKDKLIFYMSPSMKLKRLEKAYRKIGLIK